MGARQKTGSVLCALLLVSCGGLQRRGQRDERPIHRLRGVAEVNDDDPGLALELAIGEHLFDGGEPARARRALQHAIDLAQRKHRKGPSKPGPMSSNELELTFVRAEHNVLEGDPAAAFTDYLALLEGAAGASDARAPFFAEVALLSLSDMNDATDDYRQRMHDALLRLRDRADSLGLAASHQLRLSLTADAARSGDAAAARSYAQQAGCVQRLDAAGPFGPRELLGFDLLFTAEKAGPLAAQHDLGPGRGVRPLRTIETRRCAFGLGRGAHDALPGTTVVRSEVQLGAAGAYALRTESPNSYVVYVDGQEAARVDPRTRPATGLRYLPLQLSAGKHELKLKISSRHPNPALSLALVPASQEAVERTKLPSPQNELERYLLAKVALGRGDSVAARELVRKLGHKEPTAHWLVLEAAAALGDPLKTPELRRDRARELLGRAAKQNPRAWYPTVGLARLSSAEGQTKEAIEALRNAQNQWPQANAIRTNLIELLREAGYVEEADTVVAELARQMPHACAVVNLQLWSARNRGRVGELAQLSERAMACDAGSGARLSALRAQQRYEDAAKELLRLESLGDPLDAAQALDAQLERARLAGDAAAVAKLREQRSAFWYDRPEPVLDRVDVLLAAGDSQAAIATLASALAKDPGDLFELRRVEDALEPDDLFKGFRMNGEQVIKAFEAQPQTYDQPQVLVLDYTVVRLFEDGSSVSLTHNIIRPQSQEAVDENGEFSVPEGARLLTLHTRKADGTFLEPDLIPGKASWSLPNLAPGDYVEFEYVRGEQPSVGFPGGYLGDRFYFQSFEVPFEQSELVVVMPETMQAVLDPRGPLPTLVSEKRPGLNVLRWTARQSRALSPEPASVATREFLPSINLGVKVSWAAYVESLRDLLVDKDLYDPAAQEFVLQLLGDKVNAPKSVRTELLFRWVTEQIEASNEPFGSAPAMLAARTGSRERVLKYMLGLAGIESDLVLVRGAEADHSDAALPDPETFGYLVLRVASEGGVRFIHAGARHAPFGYLPPQLRGERALVVNAQAEVTQLPADEIERELRTIELDVALTAEGEGQVKVRETHRGASAVEWRNDLDAIPAAELSTRFGQQYAANVIPGARMTALKVIGRDQPEAPLVLEYDLEVADLGQRSGTQQRIGGLFPTLLSSRYARTGSRTTTEIVTPPQAVDVHTRLHLPKGARVLALPKAGSVAHPSKAKFDSRSDRGADDTHGALSLTRSLRLPLTRVTPADYAGFATFCRTADALEASELVIELPASTP
jgi:cellulose synthase operon protein C